MARRAELKSERAIVKVLQHESAPEQQNLLLPRRNSDDGERQGLRRDAFSEAVFLNADLTCRPSLTTEGPHDKRQ